jgi:hypothetical protein
MLRDAMLASLIAFGAAGGAALAGGNPVLRGAGDDAAVECGGAPPGTVLGGAQVSAAGGGQDRSHAYGTVNAFPGQAGRVVGGGADAQLVHDPAATAGARAAARDAFRA